MKKLNTCKAIAESAIILLLIVLSVALMKASVSNAMDFSSAEREYAEKMNEHVLATWPENTLEQPLEHHCSYDPAYCNPEYAKFLREHNK